MAAAQRPTLISINQIRTLDGILHAALRDLPVERPDPERLAVCGGSPDPVVRQAAPAVVKICSVIPFTGGLVNADRMFGRIARRGQPHNHVQYEVKTSRFETINSGNPAGIIPRWRK